MPVNRQTIFSRDRVYRYTLWRQWLDFQRSGFVLFIGLNPSTADETQDDPTIRRCMDYAQRWGFGALCMMNLFAYRATDPEVMKAFAKPIGEANDTLLRAHAGEADLVVAAWGNDGRHQNRGKEVLRMLQGKTQAPVHVLRMSKIWQPVHPLYQKKTLFPTPLHCHER